MRTRASQVRRRRPCDLCPRLRSDPPLLFVHVVRPRGHDENSDLNLPAPASTLSHLLTLLEPSATFPCNRYGDGHYNKHDVLLQCYDATGAMSPAYRRS